jgi:hypothetical protein
MQVYAMLVPAAFTLSIGTAYALFQQSFQAYFDKVVKERLIHDLMKVEASLARTRQHLVDRRREEQAEGAPAKSSNPDRSIDLADLESNMGQILESIHQVEADIDDLRSPRSDSVRRAASAPSFRA